MNWGRGWVRGLALGAVVPACAGMTGGGVGVTERGAVWAIGACRAGGGGSGLRTPHLASPLEGGRDELGGGMKWGEG